MRNLAEAATAGDARLQTEESSLGEWQQLFDFEHFEMARFVQFVEQRCQQEICLVPWSLPPCLSGVWLTAGPLEFVFFEKEAPDLVQLHIQIHELCHILLGHRTWDLTLEPGISRAELLTEVQKALLDIKADAERYLTHVRMRSLTDSAEEARVESLSEKIVLLATMGTRKANYGLPITTSPNMASPNATPWRV